MDARMMSEMARALGKDAERRYQSAAEMAGDLRRALNRPEGGFVRYPLTKEEIEKQREEERRRKEGAADPPGPDENDVL